MSTLPNHIWMEILNFCHMHSLPFLALSCKRFMNLIVIGNEWKSGWITDDAKHTIYPLRYQMCNLELFGHKSDKKELEFLKLAKKRCDWLVRKLILLGKFGGAHSNNLFPVLAYSDYAGSAAALIEINNFVINVVNDLFYQATQYKSVNFIRVLMSVPEANPAHNNNKALFEAISSGYVEIAELLLKNQNVNDAPCNNGSFLCAIQYDRLKIVKLLVEKKKMDPNYLPIDENPLLLAIANQRPAITRFLLTLEIKTSILSEIFRQFEDRTNYYEFIEPLINHKNFVSNFKLVKPFIESKNGSMIQMLVKKLGFGGKNEVFDAITKSGNWEIMMDFLLGVDCIKSRMILEVIKNFEKSASALVSTSSPEQEESGVIKFLLDKCFEKPLIKSSIGESNVGTFLFVHAYKRMDKELVKRILQKSCALQVKEMYYAFCKSENQELVSLVLQHKQVKFEDTRLLVEKSIFQNSSNFIEFLCNTEEIRQALNPNLLSGAAFDKLVETNQYKVLEILIGDSRFVATTKPYFLNEICLGNNFIVLELLMKSKVGIYGLITVLLEFACKNNNTEIIDYIILKSLNGSNMDLQSIRDLLSKEALCNAIEFGDTKLMKSLLKNFNVVPMIKQALCQTIKNESANLKIIKLLFDENCIDPAVDDNCFLKLALLDAKNFKMVSLLLNYESVLSGNLTFENNKLGYRLCMNNQHESLKKILFRNGVNPLQSGTLTFTYPCEQQFYETVSLLLQHPDTDPCCDNNRALRTAFERGHTKMLHLLMQNEKVNPYKKPIPWDDSVNINSYLKTPW